MQYPLKKQPDSVPVPPLGPAVQPAPAPKGGRKWSVWLGLGIVAVAGIAVYANRSGLLGRRAPESAAQIRLGPVSRGTLVRTLRVTGTTQAENYVTLRAPMMAGRRGFGGGSTFGSSSRIRLPGTGTNLTITSNAGAVSSGSTGGFRSSGNRFSSSSSGYSNTAVTSSSSGAGDTSSSSGTSGGGTSSSSASSSGSSARTSGGGGRQAGGGVFVMIAGRGGGRSMGEFSQVLFSLAPAGSRVRKGDVVASFDTQYMETRLDDFRASLEQDRAGFQRDMVLLETQRRAHQLAIEKAKAALDKALIDLKSAPVRSQIEAERLRLAAEEAEAKYKQLLSEVKYVNLSAESQIHNAKLDIQSSQLELQRAERNLEQMRIRAPIDGIVVLETNFRGAEFTQIKEGDELFPGQPFMKIVDPSSMRVLAYVNQVDAEQLRLGMKAKIRVDAFPELEVPGTLISIGALAVSTGSRTNIVKQVPVQFRIEKVDPRIIPDLSVHADVEIQAAPDVLMVPREAVHKDPSGGKYVFVRNGKDFVRRDVETGLENFLAVAVLKGLREGERVALEPPQVLVENIRRASAR